jgi:parvulin-like peptidyl-prolyl isomerase
MKFIALLTAALMAGVLTTQATTEQNPAAQTNASPEAAITSLFGDPAIVKAKGFEIKRSSLDQLVSSAKAQAAADNQQLPAYYEIMMLDRLITIQVLLQTANAADQAAGQQEADQAFTNRVKQFESEEAFERYVTSMGTTAQELRANTVKEAVAKAALTRALNINITDEDANNYYTQNPADFEEPETVHAHHILLMTIDPTTQPPTPLATNVIAQKRKQIEDIRKRILAGADFSEMAREYSDDRGSKGSGGDLPPFDHNGAFPGGRMVPEFASAAFALETNQVSDVVTSEFGFHLIKVIDRTPAKKIDFAKAEPDIKDYLSRQKITKQAPDYIKKLRADQQVEIVDADLKAADEQVQAASAAAATQATPAAGANTGK